MRNIINLRLKTAREKAGLTQEELSKRLGFKDRQTLSAIEAGQRKISAEELLNAVKILGVDFDYFTDSFRLAGEGQFSWRAEDHTGDETFNNFEESAGRWLATYRHLGELQGETISPIRSNLNLTVKSTFEEAINAGEAIVTEWNLGEIPAKNLESAIQKNLKALILYVETPNGISGAACQINGLSSIIINRNEIEGRRNFDLAHECFHLLTWDQMPPEYKDLCNLDAPRSGKAKRIEQLANNFASALLMPEKTLSKYWDHSKGKEINKWLNKTANKLLVTSGAVKWRIVHLGWFSSEDMDNINDEMLKLNGRDVSYLELKPILFSFEFIKRIHVGILYGQLSIRRAASILGLLLSELTELFISYSLPDPIST